MAAAAAAEEEPLAASASFSALWWGCTCSQTQWLVSRIAFLLFLLHQTEALRSSLDSKQSFTKIRADTSHQHKSFVGSVLPVGVLIGGVKSLHPPRQHSILLCRRCGCGCACLLLLLMQCTCRSSLLLRAAGAADCFQILEAACLLI